MRVALMAASLLVVAAALPAAAGVYSLADTADGYVYSGGVTTPLAAFSFGPPGLLPTSRTGVIGGSTHDTESLLEFSLASLPIGITGSQIASALLTLRTADASYYPISHAVVPTPSAPFVVDVFAAAGAWNNATTYATLPATTTGSPLAQASLSDTSSVSTGHLVDVTFDITSIVQSWVDGTLTNNGLLLAGDAIVGDGTPAALFMARGYTDGSTFAFVPQADGPMLVVTTVPEPASAALALLAAGGMSFGWLARRRPRGRSLVTAQRERRRQTAALRSWNCWS